ncbi:MAG: hypothetical protein FJW80_11200 [Actinobacteria bacterium]|nr:hypothetical protein [Actinomycetota bacterium]
MFFPRLAALAASLAGVGLLATSVPVSAAVSLASERATAECAWWVETSMQTTNVLYPDTAAAYWTMPYLTDEAELIEVNGVYLDARYFAIQAYGADAQLFESPAGQESAIADFQIQPNAGSVNPWDTPAQPGGSWTVTLSDAPLVGVKNLLPLSPQGAVEPLIREIPATTAFLMIRVYLPAEGFSALRPLLPEVTITDRGGIVRTLEPCSPTQRKALAATKDGKALAQALKSRNTPPSADCGDSCPPELEFFKVGSSATPFPNANSAYVGALFTPAQGKVVVARAVMPTTSTGESPEVWPGGRQLRYWSICNYVHRAPFPAVETVLGGNGKKVVGCTNDTTTAVSASGTATLVLSFPADKKAINKRLTRMKAARWLPMSPRYGTTQELLAFRNMLPNSSFAQSATNIPTTGNPEAAKEVMGRFYPQIGMCSIKTFLKSGATGCLSSS